MRKKGRGQISNLQSPVSFFQIDHCLIFIPLSLSDLCNGIEGEHALHQPYLPSYPRPGPSPVLGDAVRLRCAGAVTGAFEKNRAQNARGRTLAVPVRPFRSLGNITTVSSGRASLNGAIEGTATNHYTVNIKLMQKRSRARMLCDCLRVLDYDGPADVRMQLFSLSPRNRAARRLLSSLSPTDDLAQSVSPTVIAYEVACIRPLFLPRFNALHFLAELPDLLDSACFQQIDLALYSPTLFTFAAWKVLLTCCVFISGGPTAPTGG